MGRKLLRLLAEDNPFYLLSSLSMLIGCYTLSHALAVRPGQTAKLLVLLTTLNVYELLVIALALLLVRRGVARDGRMLLQLEVLFLVDATLLDGEAFATDFATGAWVSAAALGLAVLKLLAILRALDRDSVARILPPALLSLGALFAIPGTFSRLTELGLLSPQALYAAWWAGAATVVAQALAARGTTPPAGDGAVVARAFERALAAALPASVVVHLVSTAWVYDLEFHVAHVGPMVLALGVARILDGQRREPFARLLLPAAAVVLSLGAPSELVLSGPGGIPISPLRATLFAAAVACVVAYRLHRAAVFAWAAAGCLFAGALGHSLGAMATTVGTFWTGVRHAGRRVVPRTAESWGVVAVVWAFVLLGAGAATSLLMGTVPPPRSRRP